MPLNIDILQILLHMLNFVILAGGLTFILYRPVNKFLEERADHFERLAREGEAKAKEAEALRAEYESRLENSKQELAAMRNEAEKEANETSKAYLLEAKEKANAMIAAAEREAEERKEHILESAQTEIGELVVTATQKLLNDTVTPERTSELYDEFIRMSEEDIKSVKRSKR